MFYDHIYPLLTYRNPIWCTTYTTYLAPLKLQLKKIVRIIITTNSNYLAHTDSLFQQTKILLKLEDITKLAIAICMYSNKNESRNLLPTHHYNTRHHDNLSLPLHRLTKFQHSVSYLGPTIWNSLPPEIQNSPILNVFKSRLKRYIINAYWIFCFKYPKLLSRSKMFIDQQIIMCSCFP